MTVVLLQPRTSALTSLRAGGGRDFSALRLARMLPRMEMLTRTKGTAVTNPSNPKTVRQTYAGKLAACHPGVRPCTCLGARLALAAAIAFAGLPAFAQSTPPGATPPAASAHAPAHRPGTAHTAPVSPAPPAVDTAERPVLPRLVAIATSDDDEIPRFALFAARDIELLGLQFPAQKGDTSSDTDVVITMSLREGATTRMRDFSRQHMNEPMTLIVDGVEMLTATIRSELGGKFQLQMPKEKARRLFQRVLAKAGPAT
ncbi:hypothetical protein PCO31110_03661 [Pandoraea communis]|uniref:Preprotein translocase subunit SecD n=2 Tax=Pandoraea communis TaxID=2508297 RepID=A0A5E4X2U5_9BURK|nr:hypothetical protein PCO31110_03661 [Pandoraea communis]